MLSPTSRYGTLTAVLIVALCLSLPASLAAESDVPRTASGHPDLTGNYDSATLTPLTRLAEFGDDLYLSKEEADKLAEAERLRTEESSSASDPDREAPPEGGDGSPGPSGNVGGYNSFWIDRGTDAFEVDGKFRTSVIIDPKNGQFPPMTPDGQKQMAKLFASEAAVRVAEDGVQIHGGYGFVKDYPAEKFFRDVKLTTIGEGTSEIQRLVIARLLQQRVS